MSHKNRSFLVHFALILSLLVGTLAVPAMQLANAASLTTVSDTMSTLKVGTASSHSIRFTTPTGAAESSDTIVITFPSDFNFTNKTISTVTLSHGAETGLEIGEGLAASPSATAWGAAFSGTQNRTLTLTAPTDGTGVAPLSAGEKVVIGLDSTNALNPTTQGTYTVALNGTFGDTGNIMLQVLTNDQVLISANVAQSLSFSISDNSIGFGTLSSSSARYASGDENGSSSETEAHNMQVATNAVSGYTTTVQGATLTYGTATIDAIGPSNAASSAGTEQFGLRVTATGGTGTVTAPYADSGFAYAASAASTSQVASSSTASAATTYSVRYLANISGNTDAGTYQTTLTYVTTANF